MCKFHGLKVFTLKFSCFIALLFLNPHLVFASDGSGAAASKEVETGGGHDAPAEGGGHGEEKGKKMDLPPWTEIQNKISQLEAKMQQKKDNIEKLVLEKQHVNPNSPRVKEIINTMISEHKELLAMAKDYEKTITIFKFRFPERGAKADRKYEPTEVKSLEEMEQQLGVDGRLTRNMKKLRSQYGHTDESKKKKINQTESEPEKKNEKSIEDSGTIMIRK